MKGYYNHFESMKEGQVKKKRVYRRKKLPAYLTKEEFLKVLAVTKKIEHKLAFIFAFHSGMRVGEIVKLKPENIDIPSRRIFLRNAKFGKDRVVPLPKGFSNKHLSRLPLKYSNLKSGVRSLQIAFKSALKRSGLNKEGVTFHSLSHSFAVHAVEVGVPINQLQVLLGHEDLGTTGIYTKINPKDALDSYQKYWE